MKSKKEFIGKTFGNLVGVSLAEPHISADLRKRARGVFKCNCGEFKTILLESVYSGNTRSCGCIKTAEEGRVGTPEYAIWLGIRQRCNNPKSHKYYLYGARGISVDASWDSFENFIADMGRKPTPKHSIDRIDPNGNYCKENCRWATAKEQSNNTRFNSKHSLNGIERNLQEWADLYGIPSNTLFHRLSRGIPLDVALAMKKFSRPKQDTQ